MILFQILFEVGDDRRIEFEKAYRDVFQPALRKQPGFLTSKLLRLYPATRIEEIQGLSTEFNYEINFVFESEEARRRWATSHDHDLAWPPISAIARKIGWRGYDVVASSD
jgi:antibiotic biosynthesis monooxygenase (ABM) superfamily enzyme